MFKERGTDHSVPQQCDSSSSLSRIGFQLFENRTRPFQERNRPVILRCSCDGERAPFMVDNVELRSALAASFQCAA